MMTTMTKETGSEKHGVFLGFETLLEICLVVERC